MEPTCAVLKTAQEKVTMSNRFSAFAGALALSLVSPLGAQAPRTPDGHSDLQGIWTNITITTLERPAALAGKATLTDAEAKAWEQKDRATNDIDKSDSPLIAATGSGEVGAYNNLFLDRGSELARVDGLKRTSLIVDPPDGKIPPIPEQAKARNEGRLRTANRFDSVADRPLSERCLLGF